MLLCLVSFILSVTYALCHSECHYAECRYAECRVPCPELQRGRKRGFIELTPGVNVIKLFSFVTDDKAY